MANSSNANENSQGYSSAGQDTPANDSGDQDGDDNGNNNGDGSGNNGNGNGRGTHEDKGNTPEAVPPAEQVVIPPQTTDQDAALDAVKNGKAVPLENIVTNVQQRVGGEVLDAQQFTERGFLLYEITVLQSDGKVKRVYYYAKSGLPVGQ